MPIILNTFHSVLVDEHTFANKVSYKAALWAGETVNRMMSLQNEGMQFFFEGSPITLKWKVVYSPQLEISLQAYENSYISLVGDMYDGDKVWCTKKSLTEFFKGFKFTPKKLFKSIV